MYEYLVKAVYVDGTESPWSNIQHVTLTGEGDDFLVGDVDLDGTVTIADITVLIDYILTGSIEQFDFNTADVDGDGIISISDVTALIDLILLGH
jgi:hypothetical protein